MKDTELYEQLLGLSSPWKVSSVELDLEGGVVVVGVDCGAVDWISEDGVRMHVPGYEEREWRHLDTCQMRTVIRARVPRVRDGRGGPTRMVKVPWAAAGSRWTLMFEALAVKVLGCCETVSAAAEILGIGWHSADAIMGRAVEAGLRRRGEASPRRLCVDEKSFRKRHRYVSVLSDADRGHVLEVADGRTADAARSLFGSLPEGCRGGVEAVAMDMWDPYVTAAGEQVPGADVVHGRFHFSAHLGEAVDKVRRAEHRELSAAGDRSLKGVRFDLLRGVENVPEERWPGFEALLASALKTSRAWAIKEQFRSFWEAPDEDAGRGFFKRWYCWASRCRLGPVKAKAKMIRNHIANILTWFRHRITNAVAEGINSRIQAIKSAARGFHSFASYRRRILFRCGGLDLAPELPSVRPSNSSTVRY